MENNNLLNELYRELIRDYGEWIEHGVYDSEYILMILLIKEREKNKEREKWQK